MVRRSRARAGRKFFLESLEQRQLLAGDLIISEFLASNTTGIKDEDGERSDWIEILNAGSTDEDLSGWHLTDVSTAPDEWTFPNVTLAAGDTLVVFASGKDRRSTHGELHTNFKLSNSGEYLALTRPDLSIATEYNPKFPAQASDISYGLPSDSISNTILASSASGKYLVPGNGLVDATWMTTDFNDSGWTNFAGGVGYEADNVNPPPGTIIANSVTEFSKLQGTNGWSYGYWNKGTDVDGVYAPAELTVFRWNGTNTVGTNNQWDGTKWDLKTGTTRPLTQLSSTGGMPAAAGAGSDIHWTVRRYTSEVTAPIHIYGTLADVDPTGDGAVGRIFINGVEIYHQAINNNSFNYSVYAPVNLGDKVDFIIDAGPNNEDTGDATNFSATIEQITQLPPPNLAGSFGTDIRTAMQNLGSSAYLRIPFTVADPAAIDLLKLHLKYDGGFVAYINGVEVFRQNAPTVPTWNSVSTIERADADAIIAQDINITGGTDAMHAGSNVLAIQGLNSSANDSDFLVSAEIESQTLSIDRTHPVYFLTPTPEKFNGQGTATLGPIVTDITHTPNVPQDNQDLVVTAVVAPTFHAVSSVVMTYRINYGANVPVTMLDDGLHGDGAASDGVYGAIIPASASTVGDMIRYYIKATDTSNDTTRWPQFLDPIDSEEYYGTVVADPTVNSQLPTFYLFVQNPAAADSVAGTRASLFYNGEFYDNVGMYIHGQSTQGFPKKAYNINANKDHRFLLSPDLDRMKSFDLLTNWADKTKERNTLAYETFKDAEAPYHLAFPVRVQMNGTFYSLADFVEKGNDVWLKRLGLDPEGALYKMYNTLNSSTSGVEKKTRKEENNTDLQNLINGSSLVDTTARMKYFFDNVNMAEVANFLAATIITSNVDLAHKNYYLYRDTNGTGEWQVFPWDVDLTFGHNWTSDVNYFNQTIYTNNPLFQGTNNLLLNALYAVPAFREMYLRRLRTLMDEIQQAPGTPEDQLKYEQRMDELLEQIRPDATLDRAKWGFPAQYATKETVDEAVQIIKDVYMPQRRDFLFNHQTVGHGGEIPADPQPDIAALPADQRKISFGVVEFSPASGNQDQEYIEIVNDNNFAVDITDWKVSGAVDLTFQGGTVIPKNSKLYITPDKKAFRARTAGPSGNQGLFVAGEYTGHLSALGETINLTDDKGAAITSLTYAGNPTESQKSLRVSEIMYSPTAPPLGSLYAASDFEYIELTNTGVNPVNLQGVHFSEGIDYTFGATTLPAGGRVVLAHNPAAFASRYGAGIATVGPYNGSLDNGGENLRLLDANNETIADITYSNEWYPITDGQGFSLVAVDLNADRATLDQKEAWRPSEFTGGNPAAADAALKPGSIVINEVLTNTTQALGDWIELYNTTNAPINIGGWYLSNDVSAPTKFRIPAGTTIAAGGYAVFTQSADFDSATNTGALTRFSLSTVGGTVVLSSAGLGSEAGGYRAQADFAGADAEMSFGRYTKSTGGTDFVALTSPTRGAANSAPKVGPVVLNEIMYNPAGEGDEFIELFNSGASAVNLFDPANPANTWKFTSGIDFAFPTGQTLPAGGYALVVPIDPATFRTKYGVPAGVQIYGPYAGNLDNKGEAIELSRPGVPQGGGVIPEIVVDHVTYQDSTPWPTQPDGDGPSLSRLVATDYGNHAGNWGTGALNGTPGKANRAFDSTPPTVPTGLTVLLGGVNTTINLAWNPSVDPDSGVAYYKIYRNNGLHATSTTPNYSDVNVPLGIQFDYRISAVNADGVESAKSTPKVHVNHPTVVANDAYSVFEDTPLVTTVSPDVPVPIVTAGSDWKYLEDGSNQGTAWQSPSFDDSAWPHGPAELGYGDNDEATKLSVADVDPNTAGTQHYATTYFRRTFQVTNANAFSTLFLELRRDDGIAVYLNGTKIARDNLADNAAYNTFTITAAADDGKNWIPFNFLQNILVEGTNVLAAELHNSSASNNDISFDLRLSGNQRRSGLLSNDTDADADPMSALLVAGPTHGTVNVNPNGTFTYTPAANYNGPDSFTYKVNDTKDDSSVATVDITVLPVNDAPQANAAGPYVALVNSPIVLNGAGTSDVDNAADTLVYQWDMNYDGTQFDVDATGKQPSMTFNAVAAPRTIALRATDPAGLSNISTTTLQVVNGGIVGRRVFYNNSKYDGNNAAASAADDAAIAPDKTALLPGGTATFANYTSFTKGINGVMVDIAGLSGTPTAADFTFKVGNNNAPSSWAAAPAPSSVTVRAGAGAGGSDRVTLIWPDIAIQKQWLQVTVLANARTGLAAPDVFYFGNALGEAGNAPGNALVSATDEIEARNDPHTILNPAPITNRHDYNRDGFVNAADQIAVRNNNTTLTNALRLIGVPAASPIAAPGAETARTSAAPLVAQASSVSARPARSAAPGNVQQAVAELADEGAVDTAELEALLELLVR